MSDTITLGKISTDEALQLASATSRCFARLTVSTAHDALMAFVNAEVDRGTEISSLLHALARWFAQTHASVAAYSLTEKGASEVLVLIKAVLDDDYVEHFARAQAWIFENEEQSA